MYRMKFETGITLKFVQDAMQHTNFVENINIRYLLTKELDVQKNKMKRIDEISKNGLKSETGKVYYLGKINIKKLYYQTKKRT